MSISIIRPGLLDTIQDMGRYGYAAGGVNPGGAVDRYAAAVANMLVGNETTEAVIEIHFPGPHILFEQNTLISITGGDFTPTLNDEALPLWQPVIVRKNTILHFPQLNKGTRCYLAIHGGFSLEKWLDSYSTHLKAGVGGFHGRRLEKGDELPFKESMIYYPALMVEGRDWRSLSWRADTGNTYEHRHELFFVEGNEYDMLTESAARDLGECNYTVHPSSDRMGYQIKGEPLKLRRKLEPISSAVSFGTIQLLPDGQLIVLMADHQTTGGYPRIGHVITAHLPKLAQLRPSDCIQFKKVSIEKAEELLFSRHQEMVILQRACHDHLNQLLC
ncbi:MAG: biotin-dependent carboxyltransferase family protein [Bacteroidetes bacterium]|nr:biotin-dependent carboxyltransferase family protein [Bacteroidota bacterium]